jgi:hypothetical protein
MPNMLSRIFSRGGVEEDCTLLVIIREIVAFLSASVRLDRVVVS